MTYKRPTFVFPAWPRSFGGLIVLGYACVSLPLASALLYMASHMERLAAQSQGMTYRAVQATQQSRILIEQLTSMERIARQYRVLGDNTLIVNYNEKHAAFQATLSDMTRLLNNPALQTKLLTLRQQENAYFEVLHAHPYNSPENALALRTFENLNRIAHALPDDTHAVIKKEVDSLQQATNQAQKVLLWLAAALIPVTLALAVIFSVLLARPIKQIDQAIRRLGDGEFTIAARVTGPRDLRYLGHRLDWLRGRLRELGEQKNRFIRRVSHEFKTPLTALREGAELLNEGIVGKLSNEQAEVVDIMRLNSVKLQKLIEDLLNFNLATASSGPVQVDQVHLDQVVAHVAADHKLTLVSKDLRLESDLANVVIDGYEGQLRVVVDNLLSNAIKYSPQGGIIRVKLKPHRRHAELEVIDSGPGILPEEIPLVFEAFYRGQPPQHGHIKGSGLGLSIAKEYVLAHEGHIEVIPHHGPGAHFRITLPLHQARRAHAA